MSKSELEKYLLQLQYDRSLLTEASLSGASDYILLLGANTLQITIVKKLINKLYTNED
jgi:hypothetical protein